MWWVAAFRGGAGSVGQDRPALPSFQRALEIDAGSTQALRNLVVVLSRLGRADEAQRYRAELQRALER